MQYAYKYKLSIVRKIMHKNNTFEYFFVLI